MQGTEAKGQKEKISVMIGLLAASSFLLYYFHHVLGIGTGFTHLFYIPIILASLWWQRKGLGIALFLAISLLFSHYLFPQDLTGGGYNDYFRAVMFLVIGLISSQVSERIVKNEKALQKSENRMRAILAASPVGVALFINRRLDWANERFYDLAGYEQGSLIGQDSRVFYASDEEYERVGRELYRGIERSGRAEVETKWIRQDGKIIDCRLRACPLDPKDPFRGLIVTVADISESKQLAAQLQQAQKMEAIGRLAGGVAHDFNNILNIIIGNAELALMKVREDGSLRKEIEEIGTAGKRAASLTRQLLAFSRKQIIQPEILDLNEILTGIKKMLGRLIGEDVELLMIPGHGLWQVEADRGQMEQVIMNLVVNARDAMPKGGKLTIETANVELDGKYFHKHGLQEGKPGPYVMLAVSDTGIGMDKETQAHIFEPFFTTKEAGKGTGLGLSTVYGIVKQNNGLIWVYSEPGQGSTFKVYLPKAKVGAASDKEEQDNPVIAPGGSETILIVEDNDSVRELVQRILQQHGYRVLEAENGEDALRMSKAYGGPIDLLITDVVMPRMGGKETAERLQALYPYMKVLYMSGYMDNSILQQDILADGVNFLQKPFSPQALLHKVREIMPPKRRPMAPL